MTALANRDGGTVAVSAPPSLAERMGMTQEQLDLVKKTVAKGATDVELEFFLSTAKRAGLDPLAKQIYFIKRGNDASIQTGIDGYRSIAERSGQYDGQDPPSFTFGKDGRLDSATVTVWRKGMGRGISSTAYWSEYAQGGRMWEKMPRTMLAKCAESLALRKAFPQVMGGIYTADEMQQHQAETALLNRGETIDHEALPSTPSSPVIKEPDAEALSQIALTALFDQLGMATATVPTFGRWIAENIAPDFGERKPRRLTDSERIVATAALRAEQKERAEAAQHVDEAIIASDPEPASQVKERPNAAKLAKAHETRKARILELASDAGWSDTELADLIYAVTLFVGDLDAEGQPIILKAGKRSVQELDADESARAYEALAREIETR